MEQLVVERNSVVQRSHIKYYTNFALLLGVKHTVMWQIPCPLASAQRLFFSHISGISFLNEALHKLSVLSVNVLITLEFSL